MTDPIRYDAQVLLYRLLREAKFSLGHAERRENNDEERRNLEKKIAALDWIIEVVDKEV